MVRQRQAFEVTANRDDVAAQELDAPARTGLI
jgi:hypothetical protein